MALKIEISAAFKDADRIAKILNDLNNQFVQIADSGNKIGANTSKGFEAITRSMAQISGETGALKNITALVDKINALSKLQNELPKVGTSLGAFGDAITKNLGQQQQRTVAQFREQIAKLKQEVEDASVEFKTQEYAEMHGISPGVRTKARIAKEAAAITATQKAKQARELEFAQQVAEDEQWAEGRALGPMAMWRKAFRPGGYFAAGGGGFRTAATISSAGRSIATTGMGILAADAIFNTMGQSNLAAEQAYNVQAAQEAMSGDVTRMAMRRQNFGTAHGQSFLSDLAIAVGTALKFSLGNIAAIATGGQAKGLEASYLEVLQNRENLDKQVYGLGFQSTGRLFLDRAQRYNQMARAFSPLQVNYSLERLAQAGITQEMALPFATALYNQGVAFSGADATLMLANRRLGMGDAFDQVLARQRAMAGTGATENFLSNLLGRTGLTGRGSNLGRSALGELFASMTQGYVGIDQSTLYGGLQDLVGASIASRAAQVGAITGPGGTSMLTAPYSEADAVKAAGMAYQSAQRGMFTPGSAKYTMLQAHLTKLGVFNPMEQYAITTLLKTGQSEEAYKMISEITGASPEQAASYIRGGMKESSQAFLDAYGVSKLGTTARTIMRFGEEGAKNKALQKLVGELGEAGIDVSVLDRKEDIAKLPANIQELVKTYTDQEKLERGEAGRQAEVYTAAREIEKVLGTSVINAIAKGFTDMGAEIRKSATESLKSKQDKTEREFKKSMVTSAKAGAPVD